MKETYICCFDVNSGINVTPIRQTYDILGRPSRFGQQDASKEVIGTNSFPKRELKEFSQESDEL